jgi:presenilin-like A22 family membrane protease
LRYLFALIFIVTSIIALSATPKYEEAGMVVFENPSDVSNSLIYFALIIGFTVFILLAVRYEKILAAVIYFLTFLSIYYVLLPFTGVLSLIPATIVVLALLKKPHWMVINLAALLLSAGISAIFGISLEPIPVIVLLVILAIYDAISVYKTKHMISLAESVAGLKAPMLFVIPRRGENAYMGVGDVVMPNILIVSAQFYTDSEYFFFIKVSALFSLIGAVIGLLVLLYLIERRGGAHAGLPFVNTGAILGFALSYLL